MTGCGKCDPRASAELRLAKLQQEDSKTMKATEGRLVVALLIMAGVIIFNIYIVLTGGAGDFYDHLS